MPLRDSGSLRRFCRWWMRLAWAFCRAIAFEFGRQNSRRGARIRGGGHPQGVPLRDSGSLRRFCRWWMRLPWAFCRAIASEFRRQNSLTKGAHTGGRAPTRGAPTGCWQPEEVLSLVRCSCPGRSGGQCASEGVSVRVDSLRRRAHHGGEGTHKGCPYGMLAFFGGFVPSADAVGLRRAAGQSHLNSVRVDSLRRTRAPRGEGTHKGCPCGMLAASGGFVAGGCGWPGRSVGQSHLNSDAKIADEGRVYGGEGRGGHPQGVPLRVGFLGRARRGGGCAQGVSVRVDF